MIILAVAALTTGLVRLVAPHIQNLAAARELAKPGMTYMQLGQKTQPIDGVWSPNEFPKVIEALTSNGDKRILEIGKQRAEALHRGGCPVCTNSDCKKLFPHEVPDQCDRCGHKVQRRGDKNADP